MCPKPCSLFDVLRKCRSRFRPMACWCSLSEDSINASRSSVFGDSENAESNSGTAGHISRRKAPGERRRTPWNPAQARRKQAPAPQRPPHRNRRRNDAEQTRLSARTHRPKDPAEPTSLAPNTPFAQRATRQIMRPACANPIYTTGHLKVDFRSTCRPVAADSRAAVMISSTCSACSGVTSSSLPVERHSAASAAPCCQM